MSNLFVLINDELIAADKAILSINDLVIQRGYGVFDFFKTINGRPVFLDNHLDRFFYSASHMRLPLNKNREEIKSLISKLMEKNELPDSGIRITLTGGCSNDWYSISKPNMIITQQPLTINQESAIKGFRIITYPHQRQMPHVKTIDYLMAIWLQSLIKEKNADDVLYQQNGIITECPRSNFFIVTREGKVVTPANNILKGIIRKKVLQLSNHEFIMEERDITTKEIYEAKEAFITSTTKNILPVVVVDGKAIGNGKPGETTINLSRLLEEVVDSQKPEARSQEL